MKKVILTTLLIFIALAGAVVPAFAESNDMLKSNYENINNYSYNFKNTDYSIFNRSSYLHRNSFTNNLSIDTSNYELVNNCTTNVAVYSYASVLTYDFEYMTLSSTATTNYDNLDAFISANTSGTILNTVDTSFPYYISLSRTNPGTSLGYGYTNTVALPFDYVASVQSGTSTVISLVNELVGLLTGNTSDMIKGALFTDNLYNLDYRIMASYQKKDSTNAYISIWAKMKDYDRIHFYNTTSTSTQYRQEEIDRTKYNQFTQYMFSNKVSLSNNEEYYLQDKDFYIIELPRFGAKDLYDYQNVKYELFYNDAELSYYYRFYVFPSDLNNFITLFNVQNMSERNISFSDMNCKLYKYIGSDISDLDYSQQLNEINNNLITIKDLISDLQVQEINEIYNDIKNTYNIDIDFELKNLIGDLKLNLDNLPINEPKFNLNNSDSQGENKLAIFKQIGNSIISVYDDNNISYLYFIPMILLIIGAVIL